MSLRLSETAKRQLSKLNPSNAQAILHFLSRLLSETSDPRERGSGLRTNFAGLWRYRVGDYRVICSIEANEFVVLVL